MASELLKQDFPNLRVRSKDSAHASRRTVKISLWLTKPFHPIPVPLMLGGLLPDAPTRMHTSNALYSGGFQVLNRLPKCCSSGHTLQNDLRSLLKRTLVGDAPGLHYFTSLDSWLTHWRPCHCNQPFKQNTHTHTPWGKNLRAAKHRFESLQKPTGRLVLHMAPLMICLEQIARERFGKAACLH